MKHEYDILPEEFDLIERYLGKTLSSEDTAAFEQKLQTDPVWKEKLNEVSLLMLGIRETALKEKLTGFHETITAKNQQKKGLLKIMPRRVWMAAASCLILLSIGLWWYFGSETKYDKLYATYYQPDPGLPTTMSVAGNYLFDKGMVAYKSGAYQEAADTWKGLLQALPGNDSLLYYLGMAELALQHTDNALKYLQPLANDPEKPYSRDASWYAGLLLLKKEKPEEAIPLIRRSGHPNSKKLLEELNQ